MNKSSALAEMGDRGHNRHGPKRGGKLCSYTSQSTAIFIRVYLFIAR